MPDEVRINRRKRKPDSSGICRRIPTGAAIVFWHEAQGCPPSVRAVALSQLEPLESGSGGGVTEKTICKAVHRDSVHHCIVIWIEEDKSPDELAQRLSTAAGERVYEDKGYTWAAELGVLRNDMPNDTGNWFFGEHPTNELRSTSWDSLSEPREVSPLDPMEEVPMNNHHHTDSSPAVTHVVTAASPGSGSPDGEGGSTMTVKPEPCIEPGTTADPLLQDRVHDLSAQVIQMRNTIAALRLQQRHNEKSLLKKRQLEMDDFDHRDNPSPSTSHIAATVQLPISPEELLESMMLQSTWKKALKHGMKKMFTTEELLTSVPTLRGARMSKNGKKPLDQDRLSVVKGLLEKYCAQKNIWHPTKEVVHQELGGILFSIREANNPVPRLERLSSRKEAKLAYFNQQRHSNFVPRKLFPAASASTNPRTFAFKMPSFATNSAVLDLSERKSPQSGFVSPS